METENLLQVFLDTPSPCGYENKLQTTIIKVITPLVDNVEIDVHGNLIGYKHSSVENAKTIMLMAHSDEVGMMVQYVEDNGFIRFSRLGGIDPLILKGRKVIILNEGEEISGVIGVRPVHMGIDCPNSKVDISDLWIDIGTSSKSETDSLVTVGDPIILTSELTSLRNNRISGRAFDDKVGIVALIKALSLLVEKKYYCQYNIVVVFSVQEEVGSCGASTASYKIKPDIGIAIDMTHATDYPTVNKAKYGDVRLGQGVVIPIGTDMSGEIQRDIRDVAAQNDIPYQPLAIPGHSSTDAHAIQISCSGCLSGLICIPCRYMHSPTEVVSINDIDNTANLVAEYCHSLNIVG